ncbi:MAG: hypothetical protein MJE68_23840 [Proteobacteria bacterium]|nr:hypothetical protein [Pseudomonadota bacterium]
MESGEIVIGTAIVDTSVVEEKIRQEEEEEKPSPAIPPRRSSRLRTGTFNLN